MVPGYRGGRRPAGNARQHKALHPPTMTALKQYTVEDIATLNLRFMEVGRGW